ncbi:MAG: chromosome partitioning protein ParB, partial [Youngiibacter sp.]|nr:chromosome partitioning protein ParB [Youngiibacter sp.]
KKLGKSRTAIANTIRLLNLDARVQEFLIEGILSEGHGRALLGLENCDDQYHASQKVIDFSLSVRETEQLVAGFHTEKIERHKKALDPYLSDLEKRLGEALGTKVRFKSKAKNKGKIEIEYYSSDELERILEFLKVED